MWILTYLAYMCFHMTRKIGSVVKPQWNPKVKFDPWCNPINEWDGWYPFSACMLAVRSHRISPS